MLGTGKVAGIIRGLRLTVMMKLEKKNRFTVRGWEERKEEVYGVRQRMVESAARRLRG